jgi:hypothetical protein
MACSGSTHSHQHKHAAFTIVPLSCQHTPPGYPSWPPLKPSPVFGCRYGPKQQPPIYTYYDGDANLFGARKPHLPQEFNLAPDEVITRVELQWDPISMR